MLELREFAALSIQGAPGTQKVTRTMTTPTAVTRRQFTELGLGTNQERKTRGGGESSREAELGKPSMPVHRRHPLPRAFSWSCCPHANHREPRVSHLIVPQQGWHLLSAHPQRKRKMTGIGPGSGFPSEGNTVFWAALRVSRHQGWRYSGLRQRLVKYPLCLLFRQGSSCGSGSSSVTWASSKTGSRRCCWSMAISENRLWRSWWPVPSDKLGH